MIVRKILEATIPSGGSTAIFNDNDIPNSLIRIYSTNTNLFPQSVNLVGTTLTVTYETVSSSMGVALEIVKQGLEIIDNVTSSDNDKSLSAKQGKVLKDLIDDLAYDVNNLSVFDLDDVLINSISDGQILAWDAEEEMFVNVNQSSSNAHTYSNTEQVIGTWVDGSTIYEKTYSFDSDVSISMTGWTDLNSLIPNDVNFSVFVNVWGVDANGTNQGTFLCGLNASSHVQMQSLRNGSGNINVRKIVLQYTKQN